MNETKVSEIIAFCRGNDGIPNEGKARCAMQDLFAQRGQDELYAVWTAIRDDTRARRRFIWAAFNLLDVDSGVSIAAVTILRDHNERARETLEAAWEDLAHREAALLRRRSAILRQCKKLRAQRDELRVDLRRANNRMMDVYQRANALDSRVTELKLVQDDLHTIQRAFRLLLNSRGD